MADERDIDSAAPHNGAVIPRVAKRSIGPNSPANSDKASPKPKQAPSPLEDPARASDARRNDAISVHKALAEDDANRMSAARVISGELDAIIRDAVRTILRAQGMEIANVDLDAIMAERVTAGVRVVKVKRGMAIRPRKLPRAVAIAYGAGGSVASAYERLAAIQLAWPTLYGVIATIAHFVSLGNAVVGKAKATVVEVPSSEPSHIVDARPIADNPPGESVVVGSHGNTYINREDSRE